MIWKVLVKVQLTVIRRGVLTSQCNFDSPRSLWNALTTKNGFRSQLIFVFSCDNSAVLRESACLRSKLLGDVWWEWHWVVGRGWRASLAIQVGSHHSSAPHSASSLLSHSYAWTTLHIISEYLLSSWISFTGRCAGWENEFRSETSIWLHLCCGTQTLNQSGASSSPLLQWQLLCLLCLSLGCGV